MHENKEIYISPFSTRYASKEMQEVFSEQFKFRTWRRLWIALARAEKALGLDITDEEGDAPSNDIFTAAKSEIDKTIWMLTAELGQAPGLR